MTQEASQIMTLLEFWAVQRRADGQGAQKAHETVISWTQIGKVRSNASAAVRFWFQNSDVGKEDIKMELNSHIKTQIRMLFSLSRWFVFSQYFLQPVWQCTSAELMLSEPTTCTAAYNKVRHYCEKVCLKAVFLIDTKTIRWKQKSMKQALRRRIHAMKKVNWGQHFWCKQGRTTNTLHWIRFLVIISFS